MTTFYFDTVEDLIAKVVGQIDGDIAVVKEYYVGSMATSLKYKYFSNISKRYANGFDVVDTDSCCNSQGSGEGEGVWVLQEFYMDCVKRDMNPFETIIPYTKKKVYQ